jgi:hypothetical protein
MSVKQKMSDGIVGFGRFLGNDSPHNFCKLGREFLDAANYTHAGFKHEPMRPTYFLVFQSLENFLKAYLLAHGATLDYVKNEVGHRLCDGFAEAKAKGLIVDMPRNVEDAIMEMSRDYTARDFQYRSIGQGNCVDPRVAIAYVEAVSKVVKY